MNRQILRQHIIQTTRVDRRVASLALRPKRSWTLSIVLVLAVILSILVIVIFDRVQDIEHYMGVGWIDQLQRLREQANEVRGAISWR